MTNSESKGSDGSSNGSSESGDVSGAHHFSNLCLEALSDLTLVESVLRFLKSKQLSLDALRLQAKPGVLDFLLSVASNLKLLVLKLLLANFDVVLHDFVNFIIGVAHGLGVVVVVGLQGIIEVVHPVAVLLLSLIHI